MSKEQGVALVTVAISVFSNRSARMGTSVYKY